MLSKVSTDAQIGAAFGVLLVAAAAGLIPALTSQSPWTALAAS